MGKGITKIAVRVDGGLTVGMGHVVRTLTLVESLRVLWSVPEADCRFYMRDFAAGIDAVEAAGYRVERLGDEEEPIETTRLLAEYRPNVLIVDLYDVGQNYLNMLMAASDAFVVCLSDLNNNDLACNVLVNGFIGHGKGRQEQREDGTLALLGLDYKILRPQFSGLRPHEIAPRVQHVLITTGGYDKTGISLTTLRALQCHRQRLNIHVLLGPAYEQHHDLDYLIGNHRHPVQRFEFVDHMAEKLRWADLVITAAGDTVYEIAACGTPAIAMCHVPHQHVTAGAFAEYDALINLGAGDQVDERQLSSLIESLDADRERRQTLSRNCSALVDGRGAERVTAAVGLAYQLWSGAAAQRQA